MVRGEMDDSSDEVGELMIGELMGHELGRMLRSPARVALIVFYSAIVIWGAIDGHTWRRELEALQAERPADLTNDRAEWMAELARVESGEEDSPFAARPMNLRLRAILPPGPLAQLAHRDESIQPHTALVSGWRSEASLFQRYEVEGPSALSIGRLDLSYAATVLMPLILLLLTFDSLSSDRETGRLRLFVALGGNPRALLAARLLIALVPLWLVTTLAAVTISVTSSEEGSLARLGLWIIALSVYAVFWLGIAAWVASTFARTVDAALAALIAWAAIVLLLPSLGQLAIEALDPTPSRVEYQTEARNAEAETRRGLEHRVETYMAEHESLSGHTNDAVPNFFRASYLANIDVNQRTAPLVQQMERRREGQRRTAAILQFVSPARLVDQVFKTAAGTGNDRAAEYRRQVRAHLTVLVQAIGPATVGKGRLTQKEANAIPDFAFFEPRVPRLSWIALVWLLALAGLVCIVAWKQTTQLWHPT